MTWMRVLTFLLLALISLTSAQLLQSGEVYTLERQVADQYSINVQLSDKLEVNINNQLGYLNLSVAVSLGSRYLLLSNYTNHLSSISSLKNVTAMGSLMSDQLHLVVTYTQWVYGEIKTYHYSRFTFFGSLVSSKFVGNVTLFDTMIADVTNPNDRRNVYVGYNTGQIADKIVLSKYSIGFSINTWIPVEHYAGQIINPTFHNGVFLAQVVITTADGKSAITGKLTSDYNPVYSTDSALFCHLNTGIIQTLSGRNLVYYYVSNWDIIV